MPWYLETSAFLKLVVSEERSAAMRTWFVDHLPCWSSQLLATEALRAAARLDIEPQLVRSALETMTLVLPAASTFHAATGLPPPTLRALDALHLAAALELGAELEGIATYDDRLIRAARAASLNVVAP